MAILNKGTTYADGTQVTSTNLNAHVDSATFASGAVDDSTTQLSGGAIIVKDGGIGTSQITDAGVTSIKLASDSVTTAKITDANVTTAKIADANVTKAKIENVADMKVLGNVSGSAAAPAEVSILDEDDMVSDSATSLATQQSIKAYVDSITARYSGATVFTGSMPTTWTQLDLSGTIGTNRASVMLEVTPDASIDGVAIRENGSSVDFDFGTGSKRAGWGASGSYMDANKGNVVVCISDASGTIEWKSQTAGSGGTTVKVLTYQKLV